MSRDRNEQDGPAGRPLPPRLDPRAGRPARTSHGANASAEGAGRPAAGPHRAAGRAAAAVRLVACLLSLALLGGSGWGWYLGRLAEASVNRTDAIPTDGNEENDGVPEAMNLLLVGNDSRTSLTPEQQEELRTGGDSGLNTDTMILVHVPADGAKASFVSFPRDSYVAIPGHGNHKLNAAYAFGYQDAPEGASEKEKRMGGAQMLVRTINALTGLQIDHYAEVDLLGFFSLSSVVGGVEVNLCKPVDDRKYSGAFFQAGPQTISGADALKFVRQRHKLPRGDFDRIVRQQVFMAGVLRKILSEDVLLDLGKQRELVGAAAKSVTIDESLDLFKLARQMQDVRPDDIEFQTVPYVGDSRDPKLGYILKLKEVDYLHQFFAELSADGTEEAPPKTPAPVKPVAPADVSVMVYNGSGTPGLAATTKIGLEQAGFTVAGTDNADRSDYTTTQIRYAEGDKGRAQALATAMPGAKLAESADAETGTVQVVLGSDFVGVGKPVTPAAPAASASGTPEKPRTAADSTCIN